MSTRKYNRPCANPTCQKPIAPDQEHSIEVAQAQRQQRFGTLNIRWHLCDPMCLRQWANLCDVKARVSGDLADDVTAEAEA